MIAASAIHPLSEVQGVELPEVRPRRFWYGVAAAIASGGVFFGLILGFATFLYSVSVSHDDVTYFEEESFPWRIVAGEPQVLFLEQSLKFTNAEARNVHCQARAKHGSGKLEFRRYRNPIVVNLDNDERALFVVTASRTEEYYIPAKVCLTLAMLLEIL
jgi:hypothetical protein